MHLKPHTLSKAIISKHSFPCTSVCVFTNDKVNVFYSSVQNKRVTCVVILLSTDLDFTAQRKPAILQFPVSLRAQRRTMADEVAML